MNLLSEEIERRRRWFDSYIDQQTHHSIRRSADGGPYHCPCCGFRTLEERGMSEICPVCFWEDDGQDDHDAHIVRGGPNGQRRKGFFIGKTGVPRKTVPLLDGLRSSSAERHSERRFQATASPRTPKQWHKKIKAKEKSFTALPNGALRLSTARDNYLRLGACEQSMVDNVRPPSPQELRDQEEEIR